MRSRVVIVGAGHAGGTAAVQLRSRGFDGEIVLVGEESVAPYQRPPLSKAWLTGDADRETLALKAEATYAEQRIDLRLDTRVASIDRAAPRVSLAGGETVSFTHLVFATGARPRKLLVPGAWLDGVLELRSVADAERLKRQIGPGKRLAIIGGGYIGLEVAASARALGAEVVVVEREPRLLARVACRPLAEFFESQHRERGVEIVTGADVEEFESGALGNVTGVKLGDGRVIPCDAALVGVGVAPNDELARAAGLACQDGILVDEYGRTADGAVFAIGDVARGPVPGSPDAVRLESVPSALEQAKRLAAVISGDGDRDQETPWFWSDQFDLKLQIAGLSAGADDAVVRGSIEGGCFAIFHLKGQVIQAVEAVNSPVEFVVGRQLISEGRAVAPEPLTDVSVPMKEVSSA